MYPSVPALHWGALRRHNPPPLIFNQSNFREEVIMPNWMTHRLNIVGPEFELRRFIDTRVGTPHDEDEITLNFNALRPMPESIAATIDDSSAEARDQAQCTTGFKGWYEWSLTNWGCKWNSTNFHELLNGSGSYACTFDTAWTYPAPIMAELAMQFPLLTIRAFSVEEDNGLGIVTDIRSGHLTRADVAPSRKLRYLIYGSDPFAGFPSPHPLAPDIAYVVRGTDFEATAFGIKGPDHAQNVIASAWADAHAKFSDEDITLIDFCDDANDYLQWLEVMDCETAPPSFEEAADALYGYVLCAANLQFLIGQRRCATSVDRQSMMQVARRLDPRLPRAPKDSAGPVYNESNFSEDELREWAVYAISRGWKGIDMSSRETLLESVLSSEQLLLQEAQNFLKTCERAAPE